MSQMAIFSPGELHDDCFNDSVYHGCSLLIIESGNRRLGIDQDTHRKEYMEHVLLDSLSVRDGFNVFVHADALAS